MENNEKIKRERFIKTKKNYKRSPLMPVHLQVIIAVILGQIACGYALASVVLRFLMQLYTLRSAIYGRG